MLGVTLAASSMSTYLTFSNPATVILLVVLAVVLFRRGLYRELRWFTAYVLYVAAYTVVTYVVGKLSPGRPEVYVYWAGNLLNQVLAFMVILEVFRNCVRGHDSIRKIGITLLIVIALVALIVVILMAPYGSQFDSSTALRHFVRSMHVLQRSIRVVQIGLLIGVFAFSSYLGLSWRSQNFGIALGYGLYASVNLVTSVTSEYLAARWATSAVSYVIVVDGLAYKLTLILWMVYLWRPDRGSSGLWPSSDGSANLEAWNQALESLQKRKASGEAN